MAKILIVDDEVPIAKILEEFLSKMGFETIVALGGAQAIEIIDSKTPIDLMILDMKMPKIRGIDVLQHMKKNNRDIPAIILSGSLGVQSCIAELKTLGYNEESVFLKPIDLNLLLEKIKKRLS